MTRTDQQPEQRTAAKELVMLIVFMVVVLALGWLSIDLYVWMLEKFLKQP